MQVKLQARRSLCDRGVAQFGSALGSGPRGRGFKSRHLDHVAARQFSQQSRRFPALFAFMPAAPFSQKILLRNLFWEPCFFRKAIFATEQEVSCSVCFYACGSFFPKNLAAQSFLGALFFPQGKFQSRAGKNTCPACSLLLHVPPKRAEKAARVLFFEARPGQRVKSSYKSETSAAVSASPTMRSSASTPVGSPNRASSPVAPAHSALQLVPAKLAYRSSSCAS